MCVCVPGQHWSLCACTWLATLVCPFASGVTSPSLPRRHVQDSALPLSIYIVFTAAAMTSLPDLACSTLVYFGLGGFFVLSSLFQMVSAVGDDAKDVHQLRAGYSASCVEGVCVCVFLFREGFSLRLATRESYSPYASEPKILGYLDPLPSYLLV